MDTSYIMCIYMEDVHTGRSGPSAGKGLEHTMLPEMLDHIIRTFFPHIWKAPLGTLREVRLMQSFRQSSLRASLGKSASWRTSQVIVFFHVRGHCSNVLGPDKPAAGSTLCPGWQAGLPATVRRRAR